MSQRLSVLLLLFGLVWCLLLLHYTVSQPRRQSSTELRKQILELSQHYVRAINEENNDLTRSYNPSMAGYGKADGLIRLISMLTHYQLFTIRITVPPYTGEEGVNELFSKSRNYINHML